jgi:hypothetical protein
MLFKNLLEASNDIGDNQLMEMEKDLKSKIEKAKSLATTCKINKEADDTVFSTTNTGVKTVFNIIGAHFPRLQAGHQLQ